MSGVLKTLEEIKQIQAREVDVLNSQFSQLVRGVSRGDCMAFSPTEDRIETWLKESGEIL